MAPFVSVAVAALLAATAANLDTVFLKNGGRVLGTVVEEDPGRGVSIRLPGGEQRNLKPSDVYRIRYGDGTVKTYGDLPPPAEVAPPPPAAAGTEPQPSAPPPSSVQPVPESYQVMPVEPLPPVADPTAGPTVAPTAPGPPAQIMLAASLFRLIPGGDLEAGLTMKGFTTPMTGFGLEAGLRLTPRFLVGGFLDVAFGQAGPDLDAWCEGGGFSCDTSDVKMGLMARYAFTPAASSTPWIGAGLAYDVVMALSDATDQTPSYGGGELLRLSAGWDLRLSRAIGLGAFVTGSTSRYPDVDRGNGDIVPIETRARHTWLQIGVRGILFP